MAERIFLFLTLVCNGALGFPPDRDHSAPRYDVRHAAGYYCESGCAEAIGRWDPVRWPDEVHERLQTRANEIRDVDLPPTTQMLLSTLARTYEDRPDYGQIPDSLEEGGNPLAELYRNGLLPVPEGDDPFPTLERYFALLKLNAPLPPFLLRTTTKFPIFFRDNIFLGAEIWARELFENEAEIIAHPTFEHVSIWGMRSELLRALDSPALRAMSSIKLIGRDNVSEFRSLGPTPTAGPANRFPHLRSLSLRDPEFDVATVLYEVNAPPYLEHLQLIGLQFLTARELPSIRNLKSLDLRDSFSQFRARRPMWSVAMLNQEATEASGPAVAAFFGELNPEIESIFWSGIGTDWERYEIRAARSEGILHVTSTSARELLPVPVRNAFEVLRNRGVNVQWDSE